MPIPIAPAPVVTFTSEAPSIAARSPVFSTAFAAVGEHTPAEQFMCLVGALEITTAALAAPVSASTKAQSPVAALIMTHLASGGAKPISSACQTHVSARRIGEQIRITVVDAGALAPDRGAESAGDARLQLRVSQSRKSRIVGDIACALSAVRNSRR